MRRCFHFSGLLFAFGLAASAQIAHAGGAIISGQHVVGAIVAPLYRESWTFSGTNGDRVIVSAISATDTLNTQIYLYAPGGGSPVVITDDRLDAQLTASGTWSVVVQDDDLSDAGVYDLTLVDLTSGPLTSAADLNGGPILSNGVATGQMNQAGDFDAFTFSGSAGNRVLFGAVATGGVGFDTQITLYPPGGGAAEATTSSGDRLDVRLHATGTYTVVIEDYGLTHAGSYSVAYVNLTAGPLTSGGDPDGGTIASAEVKAAQAIGPPDFDAWHFSGTAGDRVLLSAITTSGALNTTLRLYPPGGGDAVQPGPWDDRVDYQLTATGTWTVVVEDDNLTDTGTYNVSLLDVTSGPLTAAADLNGGAIASGGVATGQMNQAGDFDAFTFSGSVGDRVLFGAVETGGAGFNTQVTIYPPGGNAAEATTNTLNRLDVRLHATGTYTVVIEDYGLTHTGNYSVAYMNLTAGPLTSGADTDGGTIASAEVKSAQAQGPPDFDAWHFSGAVGDRVLLSAITTSGALNTTLRLYPPGGGDAVQLSDDRMDYQLTASGTWTVVVEDANLADMGTYNVSLLDVTSGPLTAAADLNGGPILSSGVATGQMNQAGDFDAFTFSGSVGDRVLFGAVETGGAGFNTQVTIYPPGGGAAEATTNTLNRLDVRLQATGTYTVVIEDYGLTHTGSYSVAYINLTAGPLTGGGDTDGGTIASAEVKSAQAQGPPDFDAWHFSGTVGDRVLLSAITTSGALNTTLRLYPPGGGDAVQPGPWDDRVDYQLTASGTWTVVVEDANLADMGTYNVSLLDVTSGPLTAAADLNGGPILSNGVATGQMNQAGDFDAFTFSGSVGNRVLFGAVATGGVGFNTQVTIYPPGGGAAEATTSSDDRLDHVLAATGTYTVVIEDYGLTHTGNYSVSYVNLTVGPFTNAGDPDGGSISSAQTRTGTITPRVDFDVYQFTGVPGDTLRVYAATMKGGLNRTIYVYSPSELLTVSTANEFSVVMTSTGVHSIVVQDASFDSTGTYRLAMQIVNATTAVPGTGPDGTTLALLPAFPNPSRGEASLRFLLPSEQFIRLQIFDARGALVRTLTGGTTGPGSHLVTWDGTDAHGAEAASGLYYARLEASGRVHVQRLVRVR